MIFFNHLKCSSNFCFPPPAVQCRNTRDSDRGVPEAVPEPQERLRGVVDTTNMCRGSFCDTSRTVLLLCRGTSCMCRAGPLFLIVSCLNGYSECAVTATDRHDKRSAQGNLLEPIEQFAKVTVNGN